jgi:large subunit ribosomal protein L9
MPCPTKDLIMAAVLEVILTEDSQAGNAGELVRVRPGFARNFLLPKGLAVVANAYHLNQYEVRKAELEKVAQDKREKAEKARENLSDDSTVTIEARAGTSGKLFGAITKDKIAEAVSAQHKLDITKSQVDIKFPIKEVGEYQVTLNLGANISTTVLVKVVSEK